MNRVIDYIQNHLADPLELERLAAVACFSPFHFHRLFHAWMGETLQEFTHRLRLERAAAQLVFNPTKSVTEIALDYGFSGPSVFARAFKAAFGVSASEWRNRKICQTTRKMSEAVEGMLPGSSELPGQMAPHKEIPMIGSALDVQVRTLPALNIAYFRHVGPYRGDSALFHGLFGKLFAWAGPRGLQRPDTQYLSVFHDNPHLTPQEKHILEVALTVPSGTAPSGEIGVRKLEGGLCATMRARVLATEYSKAWDDLLGEWLPGSGYQPDHRPAMEFYLNNPATDPEGKFSIEICLPVRPL